MLVAAAGAAWRGQQQLSVAMRYRVASSSLSHGQLRPEQMYFVR